jgi:hypothetical protein
MFRIIKRKNLNKAIRVKYVWLISDRINQYKRKGNNHMCLYSAKKKERNNNVGKNNSIDDKLQRRKKARRKKRKRFSYFLYVSNVWNMIDNLIHLYHMMIFDWIQVSLRNSSTSSSSN